MFGRQIFLESVNDQHHQRRRNELFRQLVANQGHGSIPSLCNDGLTLDLNFIVLEDTDRLQPNDLYFRTQQTNYGNVPSRYLLDYIRRMEERYMAMERELTRAKMLIPMTMRDTIPVHQTTDVNWGECSLAKYGHSSETQSGNQSKGLSVCEVRNQERINLSSRRKHHTARKSKDSIGRTLGDMDWTKRVNPFQNYQGDIYPIKGPGDRTCRPRTLNNNSTACSTHNVAMILPQDSTRLTDVSRYDRNNSKGNSNIREVADKFDAVKIFGNSKKCLPPFKTHKPFVSKKEISMEGCQGFDKKHEPETSCCIDFDVKHEDHTQANPTVTDIPKFRPIMGPEFGNDTSGPKLEAEHRRSATDLQEKCLVKRMFENTDTRRKENSQVNETFRGNRSHWNNHFRKLPYERTRLVNDPSRNVERLVQRNVRAQKRTPTPRSNVHTAYTPMVQSAVSSPMLDPNGFTIQLLRLAVLLYAPALMPALNSLIARQNDQTSIPIPCFEGSNDLLTQVFRILNSQQCVPNLPYVPSPRIDENSQSCTGPNSRDSLSSPEAHYQRLRDKPNAGSSTSNQQEKSSIAVNTSLESCTCNNEKPSSPQCSESSLLEQGEEDEWKVLS